MRASTGKDRWFEIGPFQYLDGLLLAAPAALAVAFVPGWKNETLLFFLAGLAIVPLAGWLARATEELGAKAGHGIGSLLNATFGNAAELIIAWLALSKGLIDVVKASLTGSIIGNLLLVLGASLFAGGMRFRRQTFNQTAARVSSTSLTLAAVGLIIPTIFHRAAERRPGGWSPQTEEHLSLAIAVLLLATYVAWLIFSLATHKELFAGKKSSRGRPGNDGAGWSTGKAMAVLAVSTVLVAGLSELLVGSIEAARRSLGLTEAFVGVIIVATVGNAAEHATAVKVALHDKVDLSLGIAIGSSLQIALFVTPVLVLGSFLTGHPMNLEFSLPEISAVAVAVLLVIQISADGQSNWLEGVQLLSIYLIVAVLFYFLPESAADERSAADTGDGHAAMIMDSFHFS